MGASIIFYIIGMLTVVAAVIGYGFLLGYQYHRQRVYLPLVRAVDMTLQNLTPETLKITQEILRTIHEIPSNNA